MSSENRIVATETAFEILDHLYESGGATAEEIGTALDMSRGNVYKHLRTLMKVDAAINYDGVYVLGPIFNKYGQELPHELLAKQHKAKINNVSTTLGAPASLWKATGEQCVCVYTTVPDSDWTTPRQQGERKQLFEGAPGKAIFAYLPEHQRRRFVDQLPEMDVDQFTEQLQEIRERALAIEPIQPKEHWVSVAAPIINSADTPLGAIEIVIPVKRAKRVDIEDTIAVVLTETSTKIEVELV